MRVRYSSEPSEVEVHEHSQGTDIIIRRDIRAEEDEDGKMWTCEEAQGRVKSHQTVEGIRANEEGWWEYLQGGGEKRPTIKERLEAVEAVLMEVILGE